MLQFFGSRPLLDRLRSPSTGVPTDPASHLDPSRSQLELFPPDLFPPPDELPELLPVRMLNEFTYCPRLGYLEWVRGEWAENLETLQGSFGHRNVDKPQRKAVPDAAASGKNAGVKNARADQANAENAKPETIHARSITLSAPREGIIAKLDVMEIEGRSATPVDYKRGPVPDIPAGAYDPERVQIAAQALILRENGYDCREGVLYFIASKRRVVIPVDDELVQLARTNIAEFRRVAAAGQCPPPLRDSPKCPRCSLVTICLPDETNFLDRINQPTPIGQPTPQVTPNDDRHPLNAADLRPHRDGLRMLLPSKSHALPLYVQEYGAFVGKSGERLTVSRKKQQIASVRLIDVSQLCLMGNATLSAPALKELTTRGIPICHFTYGGWFHGITAGLAHNNVELRIAQYALAAATDRAVLISRELIRGKIRNCRTLLRRHLKSQNVSSERTGRNVLDQLSEYARRAARVDKAETLLGLEGVAARDYFESFFKLLPPDIAFDTHGRNRRPPKDPVNAVLSFVYSLLTKELTITLQSVGFDPMLGLLHRPRFSRPSLALDLAEEFRPIIADSVTLTVFNNRELTAESFVSQAGAVNLTPPGRKAVLAAFERRLATEIKHPIFDYKISYRRVLEVQARLLARTVLGELETYPSFLTR